MTLDPLDRDNISMPSRLMLPADFLIAFGFGLTYIVNPHGVLDAAPAIRFQAHYLPLWFWGAILLALCALMAAAWRTHHRITFAFALAMAAVTWAIWGGTYLAAIFTDGATPLGPMFCLYVANAHVATIFSLVRGDR